MPSFSAPKSIALKLITTAAPLVAFYAFFMDRPLLGAILVVAVVICATYWVRGYQVVGSELRISYPGRFKAWDLTELRKVEVMPDAMNFSFRLFGTGLFFYGWTLL